MPFTKEDHRKTFFRHLERGGSFKSRMPTGEKWPKDIYARLYELRVVAVSEETVTFSASSCDMEPHTRRRYNHLEHPNAEVFITEDIDAIVRAAIEGCDPEFFEKYTPITNREARQRMLERGFEFSDGYKPKS